MLSDQRPLRLQQVIDTAFGDAMERPQLLFKAFGQADNVHVDPRSGELISASSIVRERVAELPVTESLKVVDLGTGDLQMPLSLKSNLVADDPSLAERLVVIGVGADRVSPVAETDLAAAGVKYVQANVENLGAHPVADLAGSTVMTSNMLMLWVKDPLGTVEGLANHLEPGGEMWMQGGVLTNVDSQAARRLEGHLADQGHELHLADGAREVVAGLGIGHLVLRRGEAPVDLEGIVSYAGVANLTGRARYRIA